MSDEFWLRCEKCGRSLDDSVNEAMQLIALIKPELLPTQIPKTHPKERRHRCRQCGWVNLFVPARTADSALTPSWRDAIVTK